MTLTKYDDIINARAGGKADDKAFFKNTSITPVSGVWHYLMNSAGVPSAWSTTTGNGALMDGSMVGCIPLVDPSGSDSKYLLTLGASVPSIVGFPIFMLVDILWAGQRDVSGATPWAITFPGALGRYANGIGNCIGLGIKTAISAITLNPTVTYTNTADVSHTTSQIAMPASAVATRWFPSDTGMAVLATGDLGVKTITSVAYTVGTGVIELCIFHPLMLIPTVAANTFIERDSTIQIDGLTPLFRQGTDTTQAYLSLLALSGGTTAIANETFFIRTVSG